MTDRRAGEKIPRVAVDVQKGEVVGEVLSREGLASKALGARYLPDGGSPAILDLATGVPAPGRIEPVLPGDPEALFLARHSAAHVMAQAIGETLPGTKFAIGPVIDDGFYYDVDPPRPITDLDLPAIEVRMREIIAGGFPFRRRVVTREEALAEFGSDPYKGEILSELPAGTEISFYTQDTFTDLCRGPHLPTTAGIGAVKLLKVAGAYWRGDEKRKMLTRIYGTAWRTQEELEAHLARLEEAKRRDHRLLGRTLALFHFAQEAPGSIFWHPKGWAIWRALEDYIRRVLAGRYQEVRGPQILDRSLWERSGHWEKFRENMFTTQAEEREFAVKPMNCPGHVLIFSARQRSWRDLPIRLAEFGSCHRNEPSGTLHGTFRVRAFVQDDAHIFCTEAQIGPEVEAFIRLLQGVYRDFGFEEVIVKIATRPPKRIGSDEVWDKAERALEEAVGALGLAFERNPGEGAFYGPKIEFSVPDALGRVWQLGTIQVDFAMPERLGATYIGEDGAKHAPVMLHRAILGSLERFIGILIEHYAGLFPLWLAPVQARVVPVSKKADDYAKEVAASLEAAGLRVEADLTSEKVGKKIREAEMEKIPVILVVGPREAEARAVAIRRHGGKDEGTKPLADFLRDFSAEARPPR